MAWIPENAKWYIADLVEELKIADADRSVVHINAILIHAESPEIAYSKALEFGKTYEQVYENLSGQQVTTVFRGIQELMVIYDELEDGAELFYSQRVDQCEEDIRALIRPQSELAVFRPRHVNPKDIKNFMPREIWDKLQQTQSQLPNLEEE